jgi:hypothetical protein
VGITVWGGYHSVRWVSQCEVGITVWGGYHSVRWVSHCEVGITVWGGYHIVWWVSQCEVGIIIPLSKVQKTVAAATPVSRRTLRVCRLLKEGENVKTGVTVACWTPLKLRLKACTESTSDNFAVAGLRRTVHNFYLTEKQLPTLKAIHRKICQFTGYGGGVSSPRLVLRKMRFR